MGPCYLSPDDTDVRFLLGVRNGGLVLGLVHIGASLTMYHAASSLFFAPSILMREVCSCWLAFPLLKPVKTPLAYRRPALAILSLVEVNQAIL